MQWSYSNPNRQLPIPVQDGLKPGNQRGRIGETWWAQRWVQLIDRGDYRSAVDAGRRYLRKGQIIQLDVRPGEIAADVQGTQKEPYRVQLQYPSATDQQWQQVMTDILGRSVHLAALLADRLPKELEKTFAEAGSKLFPATFDDLAASCTCSHEQDPCKHQAAVLFLVGDRLDTNPFLLLRFRGRSRRTILSAVHRHWGLVEELAADDDESPPPIFEDRLSTFYEAPKALPDFHAMAPAEEDLDVIGRLGFPAFFPTSDRTILQTLRNLYERE